MPMKKVLALFFLLFLFSFSYADVNATIFSYTEVPHTFLNLTPAFPAPGNDLICEASAWNNDSFNMTVHFSWYKNGILQNKNSTVENVSSGSTATAVLPATETSYGDNWACKAYACFSEAGEICGEENNDSVVISDWPTYLTQCQNITVPGEYILSADILDYPGKVCFFINVSDVLLDLNNHVVDGSSVSSNAVAAFKASPDPYNSPGYWKNITVLNGRISDWNSTSPLGYAAGILFGNASNITFENLSLSNLGFPLLFNPAFGPRIDHLTAKNIEINYSATPILNFVDNAEIENFYVHDSSGSSYSTTNGGYGIQIQGSNNISIANYSVRNVTWSSFYIIGGSTNITLENVSSELAGWGAFTISGSHNITIRNASINNTQALWVHPFSQHTLIFENGQGLVLEMVSFYNDSNQNDISIDGSSRILLNGISVERNNRTVVSGINITNSFDILVNNTNVSNIYNTVAGRGFGLFMNNVSYAYINNSRFENISCSFVDRDQTCGLGIRGAMAGYYEIENVVVKTSHSSTLSEFSSLVPANITNLTFIDIMRAPVLSGLRDASLSNIFLYNYSRVNGWMWAISIAATNSTVENITAENIMHGGVLFALCDNISVRNVMMNNFTQTSPYFNRACAIQFYYTHGVRFSNGLFTNITPSNYYAGIVGVFGSTNVSVENVTSYGGRNGFVVGVNLPSEDISIANSSFNNIPGYGITLWDYTYSYANKRINASNILITNTTNPLFIYYVRDAIITNISAYNSSGNGIYLYYANNTYIQNSMFFNCSSSYIGSAQNLTIRSNVFERCGLGVYDNFADKTLIYNNIFNKSSTYDSYGNYWNTTYDCSQRSIINGDCIGGNWYYDYCGGDDGSGPPPIHNIAGDEIGDSFIPYNIEGGTASDELPLTWNNESTCDKVSECTTLRVSNLQYTLVNDISGWKDDYACITVKAENITLNCSGYSIIGDIDDWRARYGILYQYSGGEPYNNMSFVDCRIREYWYGIYLFGDWSNPTENAKVLDSSIDTTYYGIYEVSTRDSEIRNNTISGPGDTGIYLNAVDYITVKNNTVSGNKKGLSISRSTYGVFDSNIFSDNTWNLYIGRDRDPVYYRHNFTSNNFVGFGSELKPVYYYVGGKTGDGISANPPENAGFVAFVDSSGFEAKNLNMSNNSNAVIVANSSGITLSNITSHYQALDTIYVLFSRNVVADTLYTYYSGTGLSIFNSSNSSFSNASLINNTESGGTSIGSNNVNFENIKIMNSSIGFRASGNTFVWPPTKAENNSINNLYIENVGTAFRVELLTNLTGQNITIKNATSRAIYSPNYNWPPENYVNENVSLNQVKIYQGSSPYFVWIDSPRNILNITNVSFMAGDSAGILFFPELNISNTTSRLDNLFVDEWFVSLNSSSLPEYNRSANITIRTDGCKDVKVYALDGFPLSREEIISSGTIYTSAVVNTCNSNIVNFEVQGFTGYAANGTIRTPSHGGGGGGEEERNITIIIPTIEEKGLEECPPEEKTVLSGGKSVPYSVNKYYPKDKKNNTAYVLISNAGDSSLGAFSVSYSGKTFSYSSLAPGEFLLLSTSYSGDPCQPATIIPAVVVPEEIIIDAPLEVPVGTNVTVNVSYVNGSAASRISVSVLTPLNKKIYYITDENGQFSYVADHEGAYIYSAPGYIIRKSVITYAYLKEAKFLVIPLYITEPTKVMISVYSFGVSIDSSIKIRDPYGVEKEVEAKGGKYDDYLSLPGMYVFTIIPAEKVASLSARIELGKPPFFLQLFEKPEFWLMLLLVVLLIIAVDYYRTRIAGGVMKTYSIVLLTKPARAEREVKFRVVDENKKPISGARVRVYAEEGAVLFSEGNTDKEGIFSFVPKKKGEYIVECEGAELKKNKFLVQ